MRVITAILIAAATVFLVYSLYTYYRQTEAVIEEIQKTEPTTQPVTQPVIQPTAQ